MDQQKIGHFLKTLRKAVWCRSYGNFGWRKDYSMDKQTEELMLKVADYNNEEKNFFSKRMCIMFIIAGRFLSCSLRGARAALAANFPARPCAS